MKILMALIVLSFSYCAQGLDRIPRPLKKSDMIDAGLFSPRMKRGDFIFAWVCVNKSASKMTLRCDDLGANENGPMEELQISLLNDHQTHNYGLRHGIPRTECRRIKTGIRRLTVHSTYICIRGKLVDQKTLAGHTDAEWVFDEFKTEKSRLCEFNDCD